MMTGIKGGISEGIKAGHRWMLDNGAFSDKWKEEAWLTSLEYWLPYRDTCIAAVCPDVVGNAAETVRRFHLYADTIKAHGYKVAFVTQDGLTMGMVPWDRFDCLFIGGSTLHKLHEAWPFIAEAKRLGKWVHVGRVNSTKRMEMFWMADSVDGTTLAIAPNMQTQQALLNAARAASHKKDMVTLF